MSEWSGRLAGEGVAREGVVKGAPDTLHILEMAKSPQNSPQESLVGHQAVHPAYGARTPATSPAGMLSNMHSQSVATNPVILALYSVYSSSSTQH